MLTGSAVVTSRLSRPHTFPWYVASWFFLAQALEDCNMISRYNTMSFVFGVPGLLLQVCGMLTRTSLAQIAGVILLIIGIAYYAKSRGRSIWWCLFGVVPCGIFVLLFLKDKAPSEEPPLATDADRQS